MTTVLTLKQAPALRVDLRSITPASLGGMSVGDIEHLTVGHGAHAVPLAELFTVTRTDDTKADTSADTVVFEGDLSRCDRIGWQLGGGRIDVRGAVGDYVGGCMTAGDVVVHGSAGALAACEMAGGTLTIEGDVGDYAASTLPGSLDGMRGGTFIVRGNAGERFGDRMRRGTALAFGDVGDFAASRLVAGTIGIGGSAGAHVGYGMRRGTVVFAGASHGVAPSATFVPALVDAVVFWQLLARDLARHGGPFADLPKRPISRWLGDVAAGGKGELVFVG